MKLQKKTYLPLILIGVFVLFIFAVFFLGTLAKPSDGNEQTTTQAFVKGSFSSEREHGCCSNSQPVRGASTCPMNGMPSGGP
jgi:hypothetical protein